jgi:alpha-ketoglutarate-dependent taurine dioxygenase
MLRVHIADPSRISPEETCALQDRLARYNVALFRLADPTAATPRTIARFGEQLGLRRLDHNLEAGDEGISTLEDRAAVGGSRYIPYTNKPLSWHTDGYYNPPGKQIRAWILYCARDAAEGGENELLDHEIAYLRLRDHDPELAEALHRPDAMTIPANEEGGQELRGVQAGPVFSWMPENGKLHMRYSARQRNVIWGDHPAVRAAADYLLRLFSEGDDRMLRYRLEPGEGLVSNNALHRRSAFRDDPANGRRRLVFRARYYDRVAKT